MNTADYCPLGRELRAVWLVCKKQYKDITINKIDYKSWIAHKAYRQHVDECDICKQAEE